jgi:hypothetical protein
MSMPTIPGPKPNLNDELCKRLLELDRLPNITVKEKAAYQLAVKSAYDEIIKKMGGVA